MRLPNSPFLFLALFVSIALHAQLPPSGFTVISAPPIDDGNANYGQIPRLVLGANGSPLVSFLWRYPNGNLTNDTSTLYFTAWIPATNRWSTPVQVAVTGNTAVNGGSDVAQSLAYDASTNTIGIAYYPATDPNNIYIALSTNGGATWTSQAVDPNSLNTDHVPQLALVNGQIFLSYVQSASGIWYVTGKETAPSTTWTATMLPLPSGYSGFQWNLGLAVDADSNPGVAYQSMSDATEADCPILFWRPGGPALKVGSTNGEGCGAGLKLAFYVTQPRIAYLGSRDTDQTHQLCAVASSDTGNTWGLFYPVPDDSNRLAAPISFAVGPQGVSAIEVEDNGGDGSNGCGDPKIATSPDFQNWTMCGPAPAGQPSFGAGGTTVQYESTGQLITAFQVLDGSAALAYGLELWLQPATNSVLPTISAGGIANAASYVTSIAAGSLAGIFGANSPPLLSPAMRSRCPPFSEPPASP